MPPPVVVVQKKRGWGCFGCGCAILLVIALLLLGLLIFGGTKAYQVAQGFTSAAAAPIPTVDRGPAVYEAAERKVTDFEQAFARQEPATLHLNGDEIDTLIARDPAYAEARGHLAVTLQDRTASVQASFLAGTFETAMFSDRYLNGHGTLALSFDPATRSVLFDIQSLDLNGQQLPPSSSTALNSSLNQFVNQRLQENQLARDFLARVQKAGIENGELVIETK